MQQIEIESSFQGDIVIDADSFEGDYDHLFKGIRKAVKERGILGGIGQVSGLSTNKGAERRKANRDARAVRKADRNDRKNLLADAKATQKNAEAQAQTGQADMLTALSQEPPADTAKKASKTTLFVAIGGGALVIIGLVVFLILRKKGA